MKHLKKYESFVENLDKKDELVEEGLKETLLGIALMIGSALPSYGQNVLKDVKDAIKNKPSMEIDGKEYSQDKLLKAFNIAQDLIKGRETASKELGKMSTGKAGEINRELGSKPEDAVLTLVAEISDKIGGKKVASHLVRKVATAETNAELDSLLQEGYSITDVKYKSITKIVQDTINTDVIVSEVIIDDDNLFDENKADLKAGDDILKIVESIVELSKDHVITGINVIGSSSKIPTSYTGGNTQLSSDRAGSIAQALRDAGIVVDITSNGVVEGPDWDQASYTKIKKKGEGVEEYGDRMDMRKSTYGPHQFVAIEIAVLKEESTASIIDKPVEEKEAIYKLVKYKPGFSSKSTFQFKLPKLKFKTKSSSPVKCGLNRSGKKLCPMQF